MNPLQKTLALYRALEITSAANARLQSLAIRVQIKWLTLRLAAPLKIRIGWMRAMKAAGYAYRFEERTDSGKNLVRYLKQGDRVPWSALGRETDSGIVMQQELHAL